MRDAVYAHRYTQLPHVTAEHTIHLLSSNRWAELWLKPIKFPVLMLNHAHCMTMNINYLCMHQRASWTYPPEVFTSVHLFNKINMSRFTISLPFFYNNCVKIHCCENQVRWRFIHQADLFFLGQDSLINKQDNKTIEHPFIQDSLSLKFY